jgi:signal transduction histidine kinase
LAARLHYPAAMSKRLKRPSPQDLFRDLVFTFKGASEALERSYRELQDRVQVLSSELERERDHRIRLERLAAMGEMSMELAHEIRNPLGSIELYASMMEGEFAEQIVRSVRLLNHSVTNILQFGRPIVPDPKSMTVASLFDGIRAAVQPLADQKKIKLLVACEKDSELVADYELLHRMLLNLVLNALRETPTSGTIALSAVRESQGVKLTVEDTGPGIPESMRARIFDPTFSTRRDGNGLGLFIVKRIVDSHLGTIELESADTGTRFIITLPNGTEGRQ